MLLDLLIFGHFLMLDNIFWNRRDLEQRPRLGECSEGRPPAAAAGRWMRILEDRVKWPQT